MDDEIEEGDQMIPEMMTEDQKTKGLSAQEVEQFEAKLEAAVIKIIKPNPTDADAAKVMATCCTIGSEGRMYDLCKENDVSITSSRVNQIFKGYVSVSTRLKNGKDVRSLVDKLDRWSDALEGDNYEERQKIFFSAF